MPLAFSLYLSDGGHEIIGKKTTVCRYNSYSHYEITSPSDFHLNLALPPEFRTCLVVRLYM